MYLPRLGDTTTDILTGLETPDTTTGLPLIWELGLGLIGAIVVLSYAGKAKKSYQRSRKTRQRVRARKAALRAELASL